MGIAWLLLKRTFATRPKRTFLFILGYALSTAVMVTLLSVGEAVLKQAQDKDLLGGGDLILVPQGIDVESLKVGGVSALYHTIPHGRFIVRQLLRSSRFRNEIEISSPYILSRLLYLRSPSLKSGIQPVFADGSIPDAEMRIKEAKYLWANNAEDLEWMEPDPDEFYHEIDRFHLPSVPSEVLDQWAEWHYFNFDSPDFHGYLSIMVVGDVLNDRANWIISLQLIDRQYRRFSVTLPAFRKDLPLKRINYNAGKNRVSFQEGHYEIDLDFKDGLSIRGKLQYYPEPNLYLPPSVIAQAENFESGYVIPALRGRYEGSIQVGSRKYDLNGMNGYHDHNWGIWKEVEWNWGRLYSKDYSMFFGEIVIEGKSKGLFAGVFDRQGFLALFRPEQISFSDYRQHPEGIRVPYRLRMTNKKPFASLQLDGRVESASATPVDSIQSLYFIQSKTYYDVKLEIDGKPIRFNAAGNSETYVRSNANAQR